MYIYTVDNRKPIGRNKLPIEGTDHLIFTSV